MLLLIFINIFKITSSLNKSMLCNTSCIFLWEIYKDSYNYNINCLSY